jgi:hypothetical protein
MVKQSLWAWGTGVPPPVKYDWTVNVSPFVAVVKHCTEAQKAPVTALFAGMVGPVNPPPIEVAF